MPVIAEECEGSWKQPWEVWEAKEVKIIDVESDLDHGKIGEAKEIKIIDENIVKQSHYWLLFFEPKISNIDDTVGGVCNIGVVNSKR